MQQLIYSDLARNIGESSDDDNVRTAVDFVKSNVEVEPLKKPLDLQQEMRVPMVPRLLPPLTYKILMSRM